ncbi:MAG: hypothetical protein JSU72_15795, partial [Deltaproteobacteria bacterium]
MTLLLMILLVVFAGCSTEIFTASGMATSGANTDSVGRHQRNLLRINPPTMSLTQMPPGDWWSVPRLPAYTMTIQPNGDWSFTVAPSGVNHLTCLDTAL